MDFYFKPIHGLPKMNLQVKHNNEYGNTRTYDMINNNRLVVLDTRNIANWNTSSDGDQTLNNLSFKLSEPLIIDKETDVFLEFAMFHRLKINGTTLFLENADTIVIDIPELNIKTYTNNEFLSNKYTMPNLISGKTDKSFNDATEDDLLNINTGGINATTVHYKLKEQYITTINPKKISKFTVSVYGQVYDTTIKHNLLKDDGSINDETASRPGFKIGLLFKKKK